MRQLMQGLLTQPTQNSSQKLAKIQESPDEASTMVQEEQVERKQEGANLKIEELSNSKGY